MRNPKWTRDEILLTLDFYHSHYPKIPEKNSQEISDLSKTLRKTQEKLDNDIDEKYRNINGVYMKLMNFHHLNPNHSGEGLKSVSELDREIFQDFENDKESLSKISGTIKEIINSDEYDTELKDDNDIDDNYETKEGKILTKIHKYRERDRKIVKKKKNKVLKETGNLKCEGCEFNFKESYGSRGEGFIECHHKTPISEIKPGQKTTLKDLILLCSNCHRMVHRKKEWLSLEELKGLVLNK